MSAAQSRRIDLAPARRIPRWNPVVRDAIAGCVMKSRRRADQLAPARDPSLASAAKTKSKARDPAAMDVADGIYSIADDQQTAEPG